MAEATRIYKYLRQDKKYPTVWCAGCGLGTTMASIFRAIDALEIPKDDVVVVSGIGCSSRMPIYMDFNTLHTTHGRAIAYATGVKFSNPDLKVIVITGDGDCLAIGGNHFIHGCRRNIDITVILIDNFIYGMTGGQVAPTTPKGKFAYTAPYGNFEQPFDAVDVALSLGASFVARSTSYHVRLTDRYIRSAVEHKGFAIVDMISQCPTIYGRLNKQRTPIEMLQWQKSVGVKLKKYESMSEQEREGKLPIGIFRQDQGSEYCENYQKLTARLQKEGN